MFIDKSWQMFKHFLNLMVPKAFFFQWRRSAMLDFLNPEDMKGTMFHFYSMLLTGSVADF